MKETSIMMMEVSFSRFDAGLLLWQESPKMGLTTQ
jgi:hypothetical protein